MSHGLVLKDLKQYTWRSHMTNANKVYKVNVDLTYSDRLLVPNKLMPKLVEILTASEKLKTTKYIPGYGDTFEKEALKFECEEFTDTEKGEDYESARVLGVSHHTFVKDKLDAKSDPVSE